MRTFYKKNTFFHKKTQFCILIKNSNLKYELYKKNPFLELLETPGLARREGGQDEQSVRHHCSRHPLCKTSVSQHRLVVLVQHHQQELHNIRNALLIGSLSYTCISASSTRCPKCPTNRGWPNMLPSQASPLLRGNSTKKICSTLFNNAPLLMS